jgi:hypothetical protein
VISDPSVTKQALEAAINQLSGTSEPPSFWSSIANDPQYSDDHRRIAVFQLFKRHVRPGRTISEVAATLNKPTWLKEENLAIVERIHGKIPVKWDLVNSVFSIRIGLPPENNSTIYLKVKEKRIQPKELYECLKGIVVDQVCSQATVMEIGYSEVD